MAFALLLAKAAVVSAADSPTQSIDQADYLSSVPIITTATRLNQNIRDVPASITIIDREMIEASGATEVPQLFKLVPGYLSYYVLGNQFGVTNRGATLEFPGDLEIMIDGRSIYEPIFSMVEWSSLGITPEDIHYIEVVRGTNTPAYGSNAFLGAINIVTTNPLQAKGTTFRTVLGDAATRNTSLRHSSRIGGIDLNFGLNYRYNEGFPKLSNSTRLYEKNNDTNEALHFHVKGVYAPSLADTLEFQLGAGKSNFNLVRTDFFIGIKGFNRRKFRNDFQFVRWTRQSKESSELRIQLYNNRLSFDELTQLGKISVVERIPPSQVPLLFNGRVDQPAWLDLRGSESNRTDLELQHTLSLSNRMRLVWGTGIRYDWLQSAFILGKPEAIDEWQYRFFSNWEWEAHPNWTINLGAMAEHNSIVGSLLSPRIAVNYKISGNQVLHAAYSYGNRTPSILEAKQIMSSTFSDGAPINTVIVAPDWIEESKVREVELGYRANFPNNRLSIDLRLFRSETDGVIGSYVDAFPDLDNMTQYFSNITDWVNRGFDTQIQWRPDSTLLLSLQYAYSDYRGTRLAQFNPQAVSDLKQEVPEHNANLLVSKTLGHGWNTSLIWYHLSEVDWYQGDSISSHDRLDFRLAKSLSLGKSEAKAELIVHNLLDDYPEFRKINPFKTRVLMRFSLSFP